ncbi:MAG: O-methyltransferase [Gammaproteobacteria bacterium]|nr:MAG: O-methyltransferase [Gammaproteobacteria bacterium]
MGMAEPPLLAELREVTNASVPHPQMLSGPLVGRTLAWLIRMHRPKRILEIGTYTGYSALWMAGSMPSDAELHTVDRDENVVRIARSFAERHDAYRRIYFHIDDAVPFVKKANEHWDFVFLDADKSRYPEYLSLLTPRVQSGAILVADNCLWSGRVVQAEATDDDTQGIRAFNQALNKSSQWENVLWPIRDGLHVAIRQ